MKKTFDLLGEKVVFTDEQLLYFSIRNTYMNMIIDIREKAYEDFDETFKNFSDLYEKGYAWFSGYLVPVVEYAVKELGKLKYYELDTNSFIELLDNSSLHKCINRVIAIKEEVEAEEAERENARAARTDAAGSQWSGGGFGLSGAIKGAATAGALNMGGAAVSGIFNMIGRGISACSNAAKLRNFLESQETIDSFVDALTDLLFSVRDTFISVAEENCKTFKVKQLYAEDREKAERIFNNIKKGIIPEDEIPENIVKLLVQYPYLNDVYQYLAKNYDDENFEIEAIANFFEYDVSEVKQKKLDNFFINLPQKTEKQMLDARKKLKEYAKKIGIKNYKTYPPLEKLISDYDRKERTFNGIEYSTRELAAKHKKLFEFYSSLELDTESKALEARKTIAVQAEKIGLELENSQYAPLEKLLSDFDVKARTAGNKVFKTREEADLENRKIALQQYFISLQLETEKDAIKARKLITEKTAELNLPPSEKYEPLENLIVKLHNHEENMQFVDFFQDAVCEKIYVYPDIPEDKLNSALKSYNIEEKATDIIVLADDTFLGGCEDGVIVSKTNMYFHSTQTKAVAVTKPVEISLNKGWTGTKIFVDGELFGKLTISDDSALSALFNGVEEMSKKTKSAVVQKKSAAKQTKNTATKKQTKTNADTKNSGSYPTDIFKNIKDEKIFIAPDIPAQKLQNAMTAYAAGVNAKDVLVLIDDTLWGGAKDGCLITANCIYGKEFMGEKMKQEFSADMKIMLDGKKLYINNEKFFSFSMPQESALKLTVKAINILASKDK